MILADSNIIIYLRDPEASGRIIKQLGAQQLDTCNTIVAEVLGFHGLDTADRRYFEDLFSVMKNHLFDEVVTLQVIALRRAIPIQLPDAIIAATAIANNLVLWTHNAQDFQHVPGLRWFDPLS